MKIFRLALLIIGMASAIVCMGIGIFIFIHPATERVQFLTQLSYVLIVITLLSGVMINKLRRSKSTQS
ncbi:hypothetical protein AUO94_01555 [Planococcus kocurii]|uniref:Uncharacterized protein n=1 Tax=Planococcus kocurii TaxID=1374 RepID=A0ABM5WT61_9BACL|nr:hypothetical protein AUO94_01555 [Planococcus kocurii]